MRHLTTERNRTGGRQGDELVRAREGVVMHSEGDAATSPGDPPEGVEVVAELRDQAPRISYGLALQVRLRRRPRRRSPSVQRHLLPRIKKGKQKP